MIDDTIKGKKLSDWQYYGWAYCVWQWGTYFVLSMTIAAAIFNIYLFTK